MQAPAFGGSTKHHTHACAHQLPTPEPMQSYHQNDRILKLSKGKHHNNIWYKDDCFIYTSAGGNAGLGTTSAVQVKAPPSFGMNSEGHLKSCIYLKISAFCPKPLFICALPTLWTIPSVTPVSQAIFKRSPNNKRASGGHAQQHLTDSNLPESTMANVHEVGRTFFEEK